MLHQRAKIEQAICTDAWDWGAQISYLYSLCRKYPKHKEPDQVEAKVWRIGRLYRNVNVRRDKSIGIPEDDFDYSKVVTAFLSHPEIDGMIDDLRLYGIDDRGTLHESLLLHNYMIEIILKKTGTEERALVSKYLHFHLPRIFFIYDNRTDFVARKLLFSFKNNDAPSSVDESYNQFAENCMALRALINAKTGMLLDPREIDKVLLSRMKHLET